MQKDYIEILKECINTKQLAIVKGSYIDEFETQAAELFGNKYGVSTCNGTSALYLSLFCTSRTRPEKSEVIVPAYGFHGTVSAICAYGLKPVFCDVDPETFAIDFDKCEQLINENTLAVMVLQPWGNIADLDKMSKLKNKYSNVYFISDSSHAHGATWNDKLIGSYFDINCASFGMGKLVSGGELGALTTDNIEFRELGVIFSHTNRVPKDLLTEKYKEIDNAVGIKFRPHLFGLLLGLEDLKTYKSRKEVLDANIYDLQNFLLKNSEIKFVTEYSKTKRSFWKLVFILPDSTDIESLIANLASDNISAEKHNYRVILPENSIFTKFYGIKVTNSYPNANKIVKQNILQIPFQFLTDKGNIEKLKIALSKI